MKLVPYFLLLIFCASACAGSTPFDAGGDVDRCLSETKVQLGSQWSDFGKELLDQQNPFDVEHIRTEGFNVVIVSPRLAYPDASFLKCVIEEGELVLIEGTMNGEYQLLLSDDLGGALRKLLPNVSAY